MHPTNLSRLRSIICQHDLEPKQPDCELQKESRALQPESSLKIRRISSQTARLNAQRVEQSPVDQKKKSNRDSLIGRQTTNDEATCSQFAVAVSRPNLEPQSQIARAETVDKVHSNEIESRRSCWRRTTEIFTRRRTNKAQSTTK